MSYGIKIFESELASEIETIEEYFKLIEESISFAYKNYSRSLDEKLESMKEEDAQKYYETNIDEIFKLKEVMPSYHRNSIFLLIYNFFEHNLNTLCIMCERLTNNDLSPTDLTGKGINRSKLYLTKIMKINKAFEDNRWNTFLFYNDLRNIIVHNGAFISEQRIELRKKIEKNSDVIISSYRTILFQRGFIESFLSNIKELFRLLFSEIKTQKFNRI